jgi:hypothetical protein
MRSSSSVFQHSLLATALRVLCEDGLVGLGQVLDLALLAVL